MLSQNLKLGRRHINVTRAQSQKYVKYTNITCAVAERKARSQKYVRYTNVTRAVAEREARSQVYKRYTCSVAEIRQVYERYKLLIAERKARSQTH